MTSWRKPAPWDIILAPSGRRSSNMKRRHPLFDIRLSTAIAMVVTAGLLSAVFVYEKIIGRWPFDVYRMTFDVLVLNLGIQVSLVITSMLIVYLIFDWLNRRYEGWLQLHLSSAIVLLLA